MADVPLAAAQGAGAHRNLLHGLLLRAESAAASEGERTSNERGAHPARPQPVAVLHSRPNERVGEIRRAASGDAQREADLSDPPSEMDNPSIHH